MKKRERKINFGARWEIIHKWIRDLWYFSTRSIRLEKYQNQYGLDNIRTRIYHIIDKNLEHEVSNIASDFFGSQIVHFYTVLSFIRTCSMYSQNLSEGFVIKMLINTSIHEFELKNWWVTDITKELLTFWIDILTNRGGGEKWVNGFNLFKQKIVNYWT